MTNKVLMKGKTESSSEESDVETNLWFECNDNPHRVTQLRLRNFEDSLAQSNQ